MSPEMVAVIVCVSLVAPWLLRLNRPRGKSPLHPPFSGGFVNDIGCDRWMLLAATNEAGNVIYVETVKLAAGVTFDSGAERVTFHVIAVGGATEIHERYAKMELTRG
jgi:hypothetical protein